MPSSRLVLRSMRQPIQRSVAASMAPFSVSLFQSSFATAKWRPWRELRKSRPPSGEASVVSAMRREAISQALAGSAAGSFSMRAMVPQKPHSVFRVGRIVVVIVVSGWRLLDTTHAQIGARSKRLSVSSYC